MINVKKEHKEIGTPLTNVSRGPGNVIGRCLKPLSPSARCAEHSLVVIKRNAENGQLPFI